MAGTVPIPLGNKHKHETPYVSIWMDDEGFVRSKYADGLHVSLEVAQSLVEARLAFCGGKSYPLLVDMTRIKSTSKRGREYMASVGILQVRAAAILTDSPANKILGNIFLTINRPSVPTKIFTDEASAREWLSHYL